MKVSEMWKHLYWRQKKRKPSSVRRWNCDVSYCRKQRKGTLRLLLTCLLYVHIFLNTNKFSQNNHLDHIFVFELYWIETNTRQFIHNLVLLKKQKIFQNCLKNPIHLKDKQWNIMPLNKIKEKVSNQWRLGFVCIQPSYA